MNAAILFHLALIAYAAAACFYLALLVRPGTRRARVAGALLLAGFLLHGGSVLGRIGAFAEDPTFRLGEGLSILAFFTVAACLAVIRFYRMPVVGAFVSPLVVAVLVPAHAVPGAEVPISGAFLDVVMPIHIVVALGGLALFTLGFGVALMYLLLERELKRKKLGAMFARLPSLHTLDSLNYRLVVLGFVLLSVTVATGALFSGMEGGRWLVLGPKQGFALIAWGLVAAVVALRQTVGWRGRRVAVATMAGFFLMTCAYAGIFARAPI